MKLIDMKNYLDDIEVYRDGEFDVFAQCIVKMNQKIITFYDDIKYLEDLKNNEYVSCVICSKDSVKLIPEDKGIIIAQEPRYTFFKLYNLIMQNCMNKTPTQLGKNIRFGTNVTVAKNNVKIGDNVTIGNNTVIKENTIIEDDVVIGENCVIGSEGYEVKRRNDGTLFPVKHYGNVLIKEKTVLKSMVNIHKAVFNWDTTEIGKNCVIDSFTHIAHANKIGNSILIGANCTISGNCIINDYAVIDPSSTIAKRVIVGKNAKVNIGSVVTKNVEDNAVVTGNFAIDHNKWIEFIKSIA